MKDFDLARLADIPDPLAGSPAAVRSAGAPAPPKEGSPTRTDVRRRRLMAIGFGVVWMLGMLLATGIATDRFHAPLGILGCVLPGVVGGAALALALSRGREGLGPSVRSAGLLLGVAMLLFIATFVITASTSGVVAKDSFICGEFILLLGAAPLLALAFALRNSTPNRSLTKSALLGASIGLVAAGVQAAHCPKDELVHLILGHGLPVVVLALVGATVVRRLTAV